MDLMERLSEYRSEATGGTRPRPWNRYEVRTVMVSAGGAPLLWCHWQRAASGTTWFIGGSY